MKVTLQLPIEVHDGSAWLFMKEIELRTTPFPGLLLAGAALPDVFNSTESRVKTIVCEVCEDINTGAVYVTAHGRCEPAYDQEEYLKNLGEGWSIRAKLRDAEQSKGK